MDRQPASSYEFQQVDILPTSKKLTQPSDPVGMDSSPGMPYLSCGVVLSIPAAHPVNYVVWQRSNETDFILTMNFILSTSQGYPLQNSSLGQLHSDVGVVSIVHSSAGRLLLVYLSARQLRFSGYYPKNQNGALSSGF